LPEESIRLVRPTGECEIDLARRELRILGSLVPVGGRAFEVIEALALSAGEVVTKNELLDRIWPGAVVSDNTLHVHAGAIRKALGPYRSLLKTESGRGYRLLGDWTVRRQDAVAPPVGLQRMRVSDKSPVTNFPATVSRLIGRTAAVPRLRDLISAYRVVTLTGPGGIGKTSLALKVARGIVGEFADGGWLVELASLSDSTLVPSALAGVLELKLGAGQNSGEALARAIGDNNLFLLLDNCEHVIDAVANLTETLVKHCPNVTVVATSREILRVEGEHVYRVAPLEVPAVDEDEPEQLLSRGAVELFVTRANALSSDFSPRAENLAEIAAICRHLDGIPLAIELAAARAAVLGVQQVTVGLRDRFALLKAGRRTALPRHQTLRAALDWSYELLPEAEKRLLRRLAIFSGGFTLAAVAAVMSDFDGDTAAITNGTANLVAKSMVALDRGETETRWYLLETTRAYAFEKLAESGEAGEMARRHVEYCLALFAPFAAEGQLQTGLDNIGLYRCEIDNLRAALNWAFTSDGDAAIGVALAAAAVDFWSAVSLDAEACEWAVKAVARIGDAAGTRREMVLQFNLGMTLIHTRGMIGGAREAMTRALTLARELANIDYQQRATNGLWLFSFRTAAFNEALAISRQYDDDAHLRDPHSRAVADWLVGIPQIYLAEHTEASTRLQRAIDRYPIESRDLDTVRFGGDVRVSASGHLAVSLLSLGRLDAASQAALRAVEEARDRDQPAVLCVALAWAAGFIFLSLGELDIAERYGEELIAHAYKYALRPIHAAGLCVRGSLAARRADPNTWIDPLRRGLAGMREAGYLLFYPFFLVELAVALGGVGRVNDGLTEIDTALSFAVEMEYRWYLPEILRVKGELLALRGSDDPAVIADLFRGSMRQAREQQALYWELSAAMSLAELLRGQHRETEARAVLVPVYDRFTEGFSAAKLQRAKILLSQLS
jgi:non-specific serine/threonine protein kinase